MTAHTRRALLAGLAAAAAAPAARAQARAEGAAPLALSGVPRQGGFLLGRTAPRALVLAEGRVVGVASRHGLFVVGLDRDAPPVARIGVRVPGAAAERSVPVAPVAYDEQRIDGLPQDQVTPADPALLARIRTEAALKARAFASRADEEGFDAPWRWPLAGFRVSGRFGGRRILNGVPGRPHYGVDLAAPTGTPVTAAAPGVVVLARTGLHFEGGLVMVDHGQGLVTQHLHLSRVLAAEGAAVAAGDPLGEVGMEGRATGPHLCWRLKWRDRYLDPSLWLEPQTTV